MEERAAISRALEITEGYKAQVLEETKTWNYSKRQPRRLKLRKQPLEQQLLSAPADSIFARKHMKLEFKESAAQALTDEALKALCCGSEVRGAEHSAVAVDNSNRQSNVQSEDGALSFLTEQDVKRRRLRVKSMWC